MQVTDEILFQPILNVFWPLQKGQKVIQGELSTQLYRTAHTIV